MTRGIAWDAGRASASGRAHHLLAPLQSWFAERFDSSDRKGRQALLGELS